MTDKILELPKDLSAPQDSLKGYENFFDIVRYILSGHLTRRQRNTLKGLLELLVIEDNIRQERSFDNQFD
jgi:hypothetical protein